jgi:hypothetical protein
MASAEAGVRGNGEAENARLRQEIESLHRQLEDERTYLRAQLEAQRQQGTRASVREQAEAVAQRRRLEQEAQQLKEDLSAARMDAERARRSYEELGQRLLQVEESSKQHTRTEVERVLSSAKSSWRMAEEELARTEQQLQQAHAELATERERNRQLTELARALKLSLQQRERAAKRDAAPQAAAPEPATAEAQEPAFSFGEVDYASGDESLTSWQALKVGDLDEQLADEFLLLEGDGSYGRREPTLAPPAPPSAAAPSSPPSPRRRSPLFGQEGLAQAARAPAKAPRPAPSPVSIPPQPSKRRLGWLWLLAALVIAGGAVGYAVLDAETAQQWLQMLRSAP